MTLSTYRMLSHILAFVFSVGERERESSSPWEREKASSPKLNVVSHKRLSTVMAPKISLLRVSFFAAPPHNSTRLTRFVSQELPPLPRGGVQSPEALRLDPHALPLGVSSPEVVPRGLARFVKRSVELSRQHPTWRLPGGVGGGGRGVGSGDGVGVWGRGKG